MLVRIVNRCFICGHTQCPCWNLPPEVDYYMTAAGAEALSECPTCLLKECNCEEISHVYDGHRPSKRHKSSSKKTEISDGEKKQASRLANLPALAPTSTNTRSQILPRGLVLTRIGSKEPFRHSWSQWVGHTNDPTQLYKACFWSNGKFKEGSGVF